MDCNGGYTILLVFNQLCKPSDRAKYMSQQLILGWSVVESFSSGLLLNGYRVSDWENEKVLDTDTGDGYTAG